MSSTDKFPDLPAVIDVGGDVYDMGANQNVNLSHKSRDTFLKTFHSRTYGKLPVEYLLRKYMPVGQKIDKILFTDPSDYTQLMDILKRRASQLYESDAFSGQVVKNIAIRRYHLRILEIMEELRRKRTIKKVLLPKLSENDIFQLILEISWYLAHPSEVPATMEKEWKIVLESLKGQRISDILETIRQIEEEKGLSSEAHPIQYLKKLDMNSILGADTLGNALHRARNMATVVNAVPILPDMSKRLRSLTNVLYLKKYVDETSPKNKQGVPIVDPKRLSNSLLSNPMREVGVAVTGEAVTGEAVIGEEKTGVTGEAVTGEAVIGEEKTGVTGEAVTGKKTGEAKEKKKVRFTGGDGSALSIPLGQAMLPVFRYLQMLFDPIYSVLEQTTTPSTKRAVLPHLLLLLHLCNELNTPVKPLEFGLYHLKGIPDILTTFLTEQLKETTQHVAEMKTDEERTTFQQQLFHLPKVRLRSLIRNNGGIPTMTDSQNSVFHIQFFVVGQNVTIPDEATFKEKNPTVDSKVLDTMRKVLLPHSVFLSYTDASTTSENIPFRFFEVDYETLRVNDHGVKVSPFSTELDALEKDGLLTTGKAYLDQLATTLPYTVYNDAELALSVLMGLKERMPK